jgi:hypothetical protein
MAGTRKTGFKEKAIVAMKSFVANMRRFFSKGYRFAYFLFSGKYILINYNLSLCLVGIFICGPVILEHNNQKFYEWIRLNGGFKKDMPMGGNFK